MLSNLAELRRACEKDEATLQRMMTELAGHIAPPFTPKMRGRIAAVLSRAELVRQSLSLHWHLQMMKPEARALPFGHADRVYFAAVDQNLKLWQPTFDHLRRVLTSRPLPMFPPLPDPYSPEGEQLAAFDRMSDRLHTALSPVSPNLYAQEKGHHGDIPYLSTPFFRHVQAARRISLAMGKTGPLRFLDVGCGVGVKVLQAAEIFGRADGLEYEPAHAGIARDLMAKAGHSASRIFRADALEFDSYGDYDIIYFYKPMYDVEMLTRMERRIIAQSRPGTILVVPYFEFTHRYTDLGVRRLEGLVYITGNSVRDTAKLLRRARQVGPVVPCPPRGGYPAEGFMAPVRNALRAWGHLH